MHEVYEAQLEVKIHHESPDTTTMSAGWVEMRLASIHMPERNDSSPVYNLSDSNRLQFKWFKLDPD